MRRFMLLFTGFLLAYTAFAQKVSILSTGTKTSLRGLSVVDDNIVWASGSNGMVGKSTDGGFIWQWKAVPGFEKNDFRDIEAFDDQNAVIMAVASPAYILRTSDGGNTWRVVFTISDTSMFLDAMEFWDERSGIVVGDPINSKFFLATTIDGGRSWRTVPNTISPVAAKGEACFASSGTNIRKISKEEILFISGGIESNLFLRKNKIKIPLLQGKESTGANSIAVKNNKTYMIVGGDFTEPNNRTGNCVVTKNAGKDFIKPEISPGGYRSCVEYIDKDTWVTCGLNGVDITNDDGKTFNPVSNEGFHVVKKAKKGKAVFLAGSGGRVAKLNW